MRNLRLRTAILLILACTCYAPLRAQFLMDMIDTSTEVGKGMFNVYKKYDHLRIGGYIQPQYQVASDSGIRSYSGGDFPPSSNNRFTLRRGRIRFDYARFTKDNRPSIQFVFQFDGSERGVFIRDFWGRVWDTRWHVLALSTGMFARPFGYEVNLSSSDREAPERGRMSQTLMKTERDLGAMLSFEPQDKSNRLYHLKVDAGFFNGQGLNGTFEYDSYKDFISQVYWKPTTIAPRLELSGGISCLLGGIAQPGKTRYETTEKPDGSFVMQADTSNRPGSKMPRTYYGANMQLKWKQQKTSTELRAEYWLGTQTGSKFLSETPGTVIITSPNDPLYVRQFSGGFISFIQSIIDQRNQLILKFDWYDPNTKVKAAQINTAGNFTAADVQYHTFGFGLLRHLNENLKLTLYYDIVSNESTGLARYASDVKDNVFTCRLQFRF